VPIDARIPLGVTGPDPNGFTNALAAGMKMRQYQIEADREARKDELAVAKRNALRTYGMSARTPEDLKALYAEAPEAAAGVEKSTREAEYHAARTRKLQAEWSKANHQLLVDASGAILANPTRGNATMVLDSLEAQGGDVTRPRKQLESTPDQALLTLFKGWGMNAKQVQEIALREQEASKPKWDSYSGRWVEQPGQPAPMGSQPPTVRPGTVVPGGELPPPEDIDAEVRYRAGEGPPPTGNVDYEGLSDQGLDELVRASSATRQPPAPPVGSPPVQVDTPPPVDGQVSPPVYQTPAQRDAARDQRQAAKDAEAQRIAQEQLDLEKGRAKAQEEAAKQKREIAAGQRLTPADASKAQQKLVRLEIMKQQLAAVRAAWEGEKNKETGKQEGGIKGSYSAGPGARLYTYTPEGEKFDKAIASLVASKTAILRTPGVGATSDFEQAIEMADLPSRSTYEGTTEQQIAAYEALVKEYEEGLRGLLAGPAPAPAEAAPPPQAPLQVEASPLKDEPIPKPQPQAEFDSMPMPGEYTGKRIRTPEGQVYRSNGRQWVRE
jgi:hypothetical protein